MWGVEHELRNKIYFADGLVMCSEANPGNAQ